MRGPPTRRRFCARWCAGEGSASAGCRTIQFHAFVECSARLQAGIFAPVVPRTLSVRTKQ
jgi:hypothetical protein